MTGPRRLILASESASRQDMLTRAGVPYTAQAAHVDESAILESLQAAGAPPRDMADALAQAKALKISRMNETALVLGCDQILECEGRIFEKAKTMDQARATLIALRGRKHRLFSAAVMATGASPIWRHVDEATLTMRDFTDAFLDDYMAKAGAALLTSAGAYHHESLGAQLFAQARGDIFTIKGMPLLPILDALRTQGLLNS